MQATNELEFLAMMAQDFINSQPRSSQIALGERAQHCIAAIQKALTAQVVAPPADTTEGSTPES